MYKRQIQERIAALRSLMAERHIDAYMIPTSDFHESEYVGDYFKCRKFITGFTGSAGTAVITQTEARPVSYTHLTAGLNPPSAALQLS